MIATGTWAAVVLVCLPPEQDTANTISTTAAKKKRKGFIKRYSRSVTRKNKASVQNKELAKMSAKKRRKKGSFYGERTKLIKCWLLTKFHYICSPSTGRVAEWSGRALQKLPQRFESARDLHLPPDNKIIIRLFLCS